MLEGISVIICCYNSEQRLPQTLWHLANQNNCDELAIQIVLVDNASTDHTTALAKNEWAKYKLNNYIFTVIEELEPGISKAREKGLASAIYNYIIFCDDDNWLENQYLATVYKLFHQFPDAAILGGHGTPVFTSEKVKPIWFDKYEHSYAVGIVHQHDCIVDSVHGAGMSLRKDIYFKTFEVFGALLLSGRKGKQLSAGEDSEMCLRTMLIGHKVLYSPQLKFKHFIPDDRLNWQYLLKLHKGFAKSYVILDLYRKVLNKESINKYFWLKKSCYNVLLFSKYLVLFLPRFTNSTKYRSETILLNNWFIFSRDYFSYGTKVNKIYQNIRKGSKSEIV